MQEISIRGPSDLTPMIVARLKTAHVAGAGAYVFSYLQRWHFTKEGYNYKVDLFISYILLPSPSRSDQARCMGRAELEGESVGNKVGRCRGMKR